MMMKRVVMWAVIVVFSLLGAFVAFSGAKNFFVSRHALNWPTVEGSVLSVEIEKQDTRRTSDRTDPNPYAYIPRVKYRYAVEGTTYDGDKISVSTSSSSDRRPAARVAMQYRAGATVTVHYNPSDPKQALLDPGNSGDSIGTTILGLLFMTVPTCMMVFIGGSDLVPPATRLWWSVKYGRLSKLGNDESTLLEIPVEQQPPALPDGIDSQAFRETIRQWEPGSRIVMETEAESPLFLILSSLAFGFIGAMVGVFPLSALVVGNNAEAADKDIFFLILFLTVAGIVFAYQRFHGRVTRTEIDWNLQTIVAAREFRGGWQGALSDIKHLLVRAVPVGSKRPRYRSEVVIDASATQLTLARSKQPMRKAHAARDQAMSIAEPIAEALGVPVRLEGWDDADDQSSTVSS